MTQLFCFGQFTLKQEFGNVWRFSHEDFHYNNCEKLQEIKKYQITYRGLVREIDGLFINWDSIFKTHDKDVPALK